MDKELIEYLRNNLTIELSGGAAPMSNNNNHGIVVTLKLEGQVISEDYDTIYIPNDE